MASTTHPTAATRREHPAGPSSLPLTRGDSFSAPSLPPSSTAANPPHEPTTTQLSPLTRRFRGDELEADYCADFRQAHARALQLAVQYLLMPTVLVLAVNYLVVFALTDGTPEGEMRLHVTNGATGDLIALGPTLSHLMMLLPVAIGLALLAIVNTRLFYTRRAYTPVLALGTFGILFAFGLPIHLIQWGMVSEPGMESKRGIQDESQEQSGRTSPLSNCSEVDPAAVISHMVMRTGSHVIVSLLVLLVVIGFSMDLPRCVLSLPRWSPGHARSSCRLLSPLGLLPCTPPYPATYRLSVDEYRFPPCCPHFRPHWLPLSLPYTFLSTLPLLPPSRSSPLPQLYADVHRRVDDSFLPREVGLPVSPWPVH